MPGQISANSEVLSLPVIVISFTPILFGFPLHCRCIRVLHFEPIGRAAGTVGRSKALRHDSLKTELAGVAEYDVDVLVKVQRPAPSAEKLGQLALACLPRAVRAAGPCRSAREDRRRTARPMSGVRGICQPSPALPDYKGRSAARRAAHKIMSQRKSPTPRGA